MKSVAEQEQDKYSLRGRVFHQIREDILSGKLKPNEELREVAIGEEMGVSRTPVREALRQLELEGLVRIVPNKGAYVTGISAKDVLDIYSIRARLEGLCARMAATAIKKEQLNQLDEIIFLSKYHEQQQHYEQLFMLDSKFHEVLYEACDSQILEHLLKDFHHYVQRVRKSSLSQQQRAEKSTREHEAILGAIRQKDPECADRLATLHVLNTMENVKRHKIEEIVEEQEDLNGKD
ncbi:MAG: GntR family transcriptional regulator [Robinsoniella sp.]|nr:GntR family transcriptional regulator [Robinsoniella sp.]